MFSTQQLPRQLLMRIATSSQRQQATATATGISRNTTYRFRHTAANRRRPTSSTTTKGSRQKNNSSIYRRKKSTTATPPIEEEVTAAAAAVEPPTGRQLWLVFWTAALPMIGFGFTGMYVRVSATQYFTLSIFFCWGVTVLEK